jgi:hypothetical protein
MSDEIPWLFLLLLLGLGVLALNKARTFFWDVVVGGFIEWLDWLLSD